MLAAGMIALGAWFIFMGVAPLVARRIFRKRARKAEAVTERMLAWMRRYHLAASDEYYEAVGRIIAVVAICGGIALVTVGAILKVTEAS